jgi:hypothetical protein
MEGGRCFQLGTRYCRQSEQPNLCGRATMYVALPLGFTIGTTWLIHLIQGRDKAWIKLQQEGAGTIMGTSLLINLFPEIMRPYVHSSRSCDRFLNQIINILICRIVGRLISPSARRAKQAAKFLQPIFEERMNMDPADRPVREITSSSPRHLAFSL